MTLRAKERESTNHIDLLVQKKAVSKFSSRVVFCLKHLWEFHCDLRS